MTKSWKPSSTWLAERSSKDFADILVRPTPGLILAVSGSVEELFSILENARIIARMAKIG
jgi:hypothetical protein